METMGTVGMEMRKRLVTMVRMMVGMVEMMAGMMGVRGDVSAIQGLGEAPCLQDFASLSDI